MGYRFAHDNEMANYWASQMAGVLKQMITEDDVKELTNIEVGLQPAAGQALGVHQVPSGFWQSTDWYNNP
jgi:hypothetical protein